MKFHINMKFHNLIDVRKCLNTHCELQQVYNFFDLCNIIYITMCGLWRIEACMIYSREAQLRNMYYSLTIWFWYWRVSLSSFVVLPSFVLAFAACSDSFFFSLLLPMPFFFWKIKPCAPTYCPSSWSSFLLFTLKSKNRWRT